MFLRRRLIRDGLIVTFILSVIFLLLIIYGLNVGNFVISIERESSRYLSMSVNKDFDQPTTRFVVEALPNAEDCTLADILWKNGVLNLSEHTNKEGTFIDSLGNYIVYNFHIQNVGTENVKYRVALNIDNDYRKVSSAVRIMCIIQNIDPVTGEASIIKQTIYARAQEDDNGQIIMYEDENGQLQPLPEIYDDNYYRSYLGIDPQELSIPAEYSTTQPFLYNNVVFASDIEEPFNVRAIHKYTLIMWLEGEDKQCTNEIFGSSIKFSMNFRVID